MNGLRSDQRQQRSVTRRACLVLCITLAVAACSSEDAPPGEAMDTDEVAEAGDVAGDDEDTGIDLGDDGSELEPDEASNAEDPEVAEAPPRPDLGLPEVELTTPADGGGSWPELGWSPVDGATSYTVTLYDPQGSAYWAWDGDGTTVVVGGFAVPPSEGSGVAPRVQPGMSWDVTAHGGDGELVAQSGERPIGP